MTTIAAYSASNSGPASEEEIRSALKALFAQFALGDSDAEGKLLGYIVALEGEPQWAVHFAVRRFIRGEVLTHDGRFLPSSAELAREVRDQSAFSRRQQAREAALKALPAPEIDYGPRTLSKATEARLGGFTFALKSMDTNPDKPKWPLSKPDPGQADLAKVAERLELDRQSPPSIKASPAVAASRLAQSEWEPRL